MGTLSQRGTIHPSRGVVIFWGAVMGAIGAIMLMVGGGEGDALTGIQNITIIMAAPFAVVMVLMCVALARDLRSDPLVRRGLRSTKAIEQAVEFGERTYGDAFFVPVKPHPIDAAGRASSHRPSTAGTPHTGQGRTGRGHPRPGPTEPVTPTARRIRSTSRRSAPRLPSSRRADSAPSTHVAGFPTG